jgi:solute carrier family 25 folate transporter 32
MVALHAAKPHTSIMDSGGAASPSSSKQTQQYQQPTTPSPTNNAPLSSFLAGIAGGSASTILLYPLDLIKVRMQVDERPRNSILNAGVGGGGGTASAHKINPPQEHGAARSAGTPRTICTTVRGVIRHEGYLGLYRGLSPAIIGSAASWGGFFILYEDFKGRMMSRKQTESARNSSIVARTVGKQQAAKLGPIEHFTASCLAGACMVALTNPIWLIKTRLQLQNSRLQNQLSQPQTTTKSTQRVRPPYRGLFHAAYIIGQEEGMLAFYKGSTPALMLVSHGGIQFMAYEFMKGHFTIYASNGKKNGDNQWKKGTDRSKGTIRERLRDSLGYLVMGAMSKL